ncbi:MAG TPA: IPT/TIG domain-containing protein [Thermoanaerobaculia bacterium]|nr:IPT/TIG domain-containing protein [Thermoanaerobaculia bacterium]
MISRLAIVVFAVLIVAGSGYAATLPAQQITPSNDASNQTWSNRTTSTSGGKIIFVRTTNDTVYLYDGTTAQSVQPTTGQAVEPAVMMLGSGSTAGTVVGGWRRGGGKGYVSVNGGAAQLVDLNPEHVSIVDGCAFMVLQTAADGNRAFKINTADGSLTALSSDTAAANNGAFRVVASGCTKAVVGWKSNGTAPVELKYWDGSTSTNVDSGVLDLTVNFVGGKLLYTKEVGGIDQVFLIDTNVSLSPVQLTAETNSAVILRRPQTDGRHIAWYRSDAAGNQIVLNGGVVFPTGPVGQIDAVEFPFQLNRGQLLWTNANSAPQTFFYDDGTQTFTIDPSPATNVIRPWLTDGYIAFLGPTPTGGTDNDVFRVTGTPPADANQPAPPLIVLPTVGTTQVRWDSVLGATSYNAYVAYAPGVTKDNYASLLGGRKITGVTSGFNIPDVPVNTTYYVAITAVEGATEGPSSRVGSTTFLGTMTWNSVGGLGSTTFFSVAADPANASLVYAGANGSVYKSSDGGINWPQVLSNATTGSTRVRALVVSSPRVFANTNLGDIWRSPDNGGMWGRILDATGNGAFGSLAIDPANPSIIYAGNFDTANLLTESTIIKSINSGDTWTHTAQGPSSPDAIEANALATAATTPTTVYAGANGTPNAAKTVDGGATWTSAQITGGGQLQSLAVNPANTSMIYASTRDKGVFKTVDGGTNWAPKNNGLAGVSTTFSGGAEFNSILVDPQNPNLLHLGAGNGYWFSVDGGENWTAANTGFGGAPAYIYALAMTPGRRLIAATSTGLYMLSFAPAPVVSSVSPNSGNIGGNSPVTITGTGFQTGATVTFGDTAATSVTVVSATTITATAPAHAAGAVDVVVTNPDFQSALLAGGYTYTNAPSVPTGFAATAQTANSILVEWNPATGATSYRVFRRAPGGVVTQVDTAATSYTDTTVAAGTSYLYWVRGMNASGSSGDSAFDIATTIIFANEPLTAGITVQANHLAQLRTAANAVRQLAGLVAAGFTDAASAGVVVRAIHVTEMRSALDPALTALGVTAGGYTDSTLGGVVVKATHFQEIRNRIK